MIKRAVYSVFRVQSIVMLLKVDENGNARGKRTVHLDIYLLALSLFFQAYQKLRMLCVKK